jgi:hydrogenase nickel incorporation protein HypB
MCGTCGCGESARIRVLGGDGRGYRDDAADRSDAAPNDRAYGDAIDEMDHSHQRGHRHGEGHSHGQDHGHAQDPGHGSGTQADGAGRGRTVMLQQKILAKNDRLAERNRQWLRDRHIVAVNLMSSPGAGKTTLLERTARALLAELTLSVIEGDQETALDAQRIETAGCRVVQINTGAGCHLDASMVAAGLQALDPPPGSVVIIENVGNLVCPALFDLGENSKVVITSVTEGADKPAKYPQMFAAADLILLNKTDLLPYVDFDTSRHAADLARITPYARVLPLSATTGDGVAAWHDWLRRRVSG